MTGRDEFEQDIADIQAAILRLLDADPVSDLARVRRDDCVTAYRRHLAWLRERDRGFVIEDRL